MKLVNKKKFVVRIIETTIIITTIVCTILGISYADRTRGYKAFGGEYLIPLVGFEMITIIEEIYEENKRKERA